MALRNAHGGNITVDDAYTRSSCMPHLTKRQQRPERAGLWNARPHDVVTGKRTPDLRLKQREIERPRRLRDRKDTLSRRGNNAHTKYANRMNHAASLIMSELA